MACPLTYTKDKHEMQFGTNHLGHYLLTGLLIDLLLQSSDARIVNVSSLAHGIAWGLTLTSLTSSHQKQHRNRGTDTGFQRWQMFILLKVIVNVSSLAHGMAWGSDFDFADIKSSETT